MLAVITESFRVLLTASLIASGLLAGTRFARTVFPAQSPATTVMVGAVAYFWMLTALFLALAACGCFLLPIGIMLHSLTLIYALGGRHGCSSWGGALAKFLKGLPPFTRYCTGVFLGFVLLTVTRLLLAVPISYDALTYHATKAAFWAQTGSYQLMEGPSGWEWYRLRVGGSEALRAWLFLFAGSDTFVTCFDCVEWLLIGCATYALLELFPASSAARVQASLYVLTFPIMISLLGSGYSELYVTFLVLVLLIGFFRAFKHNEPRWLYLVAASIGLLFGAKETVWPLCGVAAVLNCLALLVIGAQVRPVRVRCLRFVYQLFIVGAVTIPWFVWVYLETGYLFPFELAIGGYQLGYVSPFVNTYSASFASGSNDWLLIEFASLLNIFGAPGSGYPTFTVCFLLVVFAGVTSGAFYQRSQSLIVLLLFSFCFALYFHPGLAPLKRQTPFDMSRFLLYGAVPLGALCWLQVCKGGAAWWTRALLIVQFFGSLRLYAQSWSNDELLIVPSMLVVVAIGIALKRRSSWLRLVPLLVVASMLLVFVRDRQRETFIRHSTLHTPTEKSWVEGAIYLDRDKEPKRIAITCGPKATGDNLLMYLFVGSLLQNKLLYVSPRLSGEPLNTSLSIEVQGVDRATWIGRLRSAQVDYLVSLAPPALELLWIKGAPEFEPVAGDGESWGVYRLNQD